MREPLRFVLFRSRKILMCICQPVLTFVLMLLFNANFCHNVFLCRTVSLFSLFHSLWLACQCLNVYCSVLHLLLSLLLNNHDSMAITYGNCSTVLFFVFSLSLRRHTHTLTYQWPNRFYSIPSFMCS